MVGFIGNWLLTTKKKLSCQQKGPISLSQILVRSKRMPWCKQAYTLAEISDILVLKAGRVSGTLLRRLYHLLATSVVRVISISSASSVLSPSRSSPTDTVICLRLALTELSATLQRYEPSIKELVSANELE